MAKTRRTARTRAKTLGRDRPKTRKFKTRKTKVRTSKVRKSGAPKVLSTEPRKPNPIKSRRRKAKHSWGLEAARLREQLKTSRLQQEASAEILRAVVNAAGDAAGPLQLIA